MVSKVEFCVKMGQKLGKVPIKSVFYGKDGMDYAIKVLQHGFTTPLNPHPPAPWGLAGWLTQVRNGVQDEGLVSWGIK